MTLKFKIRPLIKDFVLPTKGTESSAGWDIYMPENGIVHPNTDVGLKVPLGFSLELPKDYVGLLLPRSGVGAKQGLSLNNTVGVIDSDYRGECIANLRVRNNEFIQWNKGDKLLQMLIIPAPEFEIVVADTLTDTSRGSGGFGSTG